REAAGIQTLHLADEFLEISQRRRLALEVLAQRVQLAHGFLVSALNFLGRGRPRLGFVSWRPSAACVAAIPPAIDGTVAAAGPSAVARTANCSVGSARR